MPKTKTKRTGVATRRQAKRVNVPAPTNDLNSTSNLRATSSNSNNQNESVNEGLNNVQNDVVNNTVVNNNTATSVIRMPENQNNPIIITNAMAHPGPSSDAGTYGGVAIESIHSDNTRQLNGQNFSNSIYLPTKEIIGLIPVFNGENMSVNTFIGACKQASLLIAPAYKDYLLNVIKTRIQGKASRYVTNDINSSLDTILSSLKLAFAPQRTMSQWQNELSNIFQKENESIVDYVTRINNIVQGIKYPGETGVAFSNSTQETARDSFIRGLRGELGMRVGIVRPPTLSAAITLAVETQKEVEQRDNMFKTKTSSSNDNKNNADQVRQINFSKSRNAAHKKHGKVKMTESHNKYNFNQNYQNKNSQNCFACGKTGHSKKFCRSQHKPGYCTFCKKIGHIVFNCRKRNMQNDNSNNQNQNNKVESNQSNSGEAQVKHASVKLTSSDRVPSSCVMISSEDLRKMKCLLLVDSGADVNLIKEKCLSPNTKINRNLIYILSGITPGTEETIGEVEITFQSISCKFQVVRDNFPIKYDGIISNEFIVNQRATYCLEEKCLKVISKNISIPLIFDPIVIPSRTKVKVGIRVINNDIKVGYLPRLDLGNQIYAGDALVTNNEGIAWIYVTNSNETEKKITIPPQTLIDVESSNSNPDKSKLKFRNFSEDVSLDDRVEKLVDAFHLDELSEEERKSMIRVLSKFPHQVYLPGDILKGTNVTTHKIPTKDEIPISTKQYRYPVIHKEEIQKQIKDLLMNDIIEPSTSPYNSPVWIVPKKPDSAGNKRWRMVIDFRNLNEKTIGDAYPLPNITEILDQLGGAKYFSVLDLASGFHQIPMDEADKMKTAFSTPNGHYQYKRMPFGLKNAPATFQRLMDQVLSGLQGTELFVYLDDIVIYASSLEEHEQKLMKLLGRLRTAGLVLQPDKCKFLQTSVTYLGHVVSENGVTPDPDKLKAVKEFPVPRTAKNVKQFLGLVGYYRRFISDMAKIVRPLTLLLKKGQKFFWNTEQQKAFEELRDRLCKQPILQFPDFTREFIVTTDASFYALGAVLSQGEIGKDLPIAFASKLLKGAEINYSVIEKELFAIVFAVKYFRPYLYGRRFKIITDHRPLVWAHKIKDPASRLLRWVLYLRDYEYDVIHKPGRLNANADALSRNPVGFTELATQLEPANIKFTTSILYNESNDEILLEDELNNYVGGINNNELNKIRKIMCINNLKETKINTEIGTDKAVSIKNYFQGIRTVPADQRPCVELEGGGRKVTVLATQGAVQPEECLFTKGLNLETETSVFMENENGHSAETSVFLENENHPEMETSVFCRHKVVVKPGPEISWSEHSVNMLTLQGTSPQNEIETEFEKLNCTELSEIIEKQNKVLTIEASERSNFKLNANNSNNPASSSSRVCEKCNIVHTESMDISDKLNDSSHPTNIELNDDFPESLSDDENNDSSEDEENESNELKSSIKNPNNEKTLNVFSETRDGLLMKKDNIATFISADFKIRTQIMQELVANKLIKESDFPSDKPEIGDVVIFKNDNFHIFLIVIKDWVEDKIQLKNVCMAISKLKETMDYFSVKTVRIARNGNGLDKLPWGNIKMHLEKTFSNEYHVTLCLNEIEIPSEDKRESIIKEFHECKVNGHKGVKKTYERIRQHYYWKNMKSEVQKFVKHCVSCQKNKLVRVKTRQPMVITDTPQSAFEKIAIDIVGPLPITTSGNRYILTIQDNLTKYCLAIPLAETTAITIAKAITENFICIFGCPDSILTDQGSNFTSKLMKNFAKLFKITQLKTTAFHPQTNGSLERSHLVLVEYLKHYTDAKKDWDTWLKYAMFSYNTTVHESTGFTPHELVFGRIAKIPSSFAKDNVPVTYVEYLGDLVDKLKITISQATNNIDKAKLKSKIYYDSRVNAKNFKEGDLVFLINDAKVNKLDPNYVGPYTVDKILPNENAVIKLSEFKTKTVHLNKLKPAYI